MSEERKSFPLRIPQSLFDDLKRWSEQELRSVNGQIEFLLREAVKKRFGKRHGGELEKNDIDSEPPSE